jgi:hypothetical protein
MNYFSLSTFNNEKKSSNSFYGMLFLSGMGISMAVLGIVILVRNEKPVSKKV